MPQVVVGELQMQSDSQAIRATQEEHDNKNHEQKVDYSSRAEEVQSEAPIEKKSHEERLIVTKTHLDVFEVSLEEFY